MPRVERKKSALAGLSPIQAPTQQPVPESEPATTAAAPTPTPTPAAAADTRRKKQTYNASPIEEGRFRATYAAMAGYGPGRYASYNEFKLAALTALCDQLEAEHNNGAPFPSAEGIVFPRGVRPTV